MYLGTNATIEEKIKTGVVTSDDLESLLNELASVKRELEISNRDNELISEQLSFARDLLENIEYGLDSARSAKQAKEAFVKSCADSYFER